jgi:site-specific DNA-cytosine methylase
VLEDGPLPTRYFLSSKAASGILLRAERRGKELPPMLREALLCAAGMEYLKQNSETTKPTPLSPQPGDPCHTLHRNEPPMLVRMREGKEGGGKGPLVSEDQSLTLATANDQVLAIRTANTNANGHGVADGITHTLDQAQGQAVMIGMQVRRLTPVECERLQGFPDGYTNIPWRGKPESPDGPRYKALGNSWAVTVVNYIGQRIQSVSK